MFASPHCPSPCNYLDKHHTHILERVEHCVICFTADGRAIGVYSDSVPWASLGRILAMPRASHVEFDTTKQQWVARDARSGRIVASYRSREAVLHEEHEH